MTPPRTTTTGTAADHAAQTPAPALGGWRVDGGQKIRPARGKRPGQTGSQPARGKRPGPTATQTAREKRPRPPDSQPARGKRPGPPDSQPARGKRPGPPGIQPARGRRPGRPSAARVTCPASQYAWWAESLPPRRCVPGGPSHFPRVAVYLVGRVTSPASLCGCLAESLPPRRCVAVWPSHFPRVVVFSARRQHATPPALDSVRAGVWAAWSAAVPVVVVRGGVTCRALHTVRFAGCRAHSWAPSGGRWRCAPEDFGHAGWQRCPECGAIACEQRPFSQTCCETEHDQRTSRAPCVVATFRSDSKGATAAQSGAADMRKGLTCALSNHLPFCAAAVAVASARSACLRYAAAWPCCMTRRARTWPQSGAPTWSSSFIPNRRRRDRQ